MPELTVSATIVRALFEFAVSRGAARSALTVRSRLALVDLEDQDNRIPFRNYVALMRAGQDLCGDPALALHFGETVDASEVSIGCLIPGAESVDGGFAQVNRYARLSVDVEGTTGSDRFRLERTGGRRLWIIDTRRNPDEFPELTESTFARMVCSTRRGLGDSGMFKAVHFTHAEPPYRVEYDRIFRMPITFRSDKNAIVVDEALLTAYRLPMPSAYVTGILKARAEELLSKMERSETTRGRVEQLLTPILQTGRARADTIAREMGLTRQTLYRRLKAEGASFETVLTELRCSLARHYLNGGKTSVKETAYLVGFSDPTAFSRAFKRWTGHPPSALSLSNDVREGGAQITN